MLAPEFLQIWSCPDSRTCFLSPAPAAAPPCWPPEGPPLIGGPPQSPQKPPKEEILFLPLQAGNYRMFLLEVFGFRTAECSSLLSHRFPFPVGRSPSAKDVLGPYLPFPHPLRLCLLQAKQNMPRSPEEPTGNDPNTPTADPFQN